MKRRLASACLLLAALPAGADSNDHWKSSASPSASEEPVPSSVTVERVGVDSITSTQTEAVQSDLVTTNTNGDNGSIVLRTEAGSITLTDGTVPDDGSAVSAHGAGTILIAAEGAGTSIAAQDDADVSSTSGHVSLAATLDVDLQTNVDVTTGVGGTIDIEATSGSMTMDATATLETVNGDIRVTAGDAVDDQLVAGDITASNASVSLETPGSVLDADGDDTDNDVTALGLRIDAGKGVGLLAGNSLTLPVNALETSVDTLSVWVAGDDGINILEADAVTVGDVVSPLDGTGTQSFDASSSSLHGLADRDLLGVGLPDIELKGRKALAAREPGVGQQLLRGLWIVDVGIEKL